MATDTPLRPADSAAFDEDRGQSRPAPAASGWAPRLRRLIGIDEPLLAWVPEERARYTWYGVLVVNTALLGALSMVLALSSFRSDLPLAAVAVVAVLWFWVVLAWTAGWSPARTARRSANGHCWSVSFSRCCWACSSPSRSSSRSSTRRSARR